MGNLFEFKCGTQFCTFRDLENVCTRVPFARSSSKICIKAQRYVFGVGGISQNPPVEREVESASFATASRGGLENYFRNFKSINVAAILMTPSPRHGIIAYFMHANLGDTGDMTLQRIVQRSTLNLEYMNEISKENLIGSVGLYLCTAQRVVCKYN